MPTTNGVYSLNTEEELYDIAVSIIQDTFGLDTPITPEDFHGMTARVWARFGLNLQYDERKLLSSFFVDEQVGTQLDLGLTPFRRRQGAPSSGIASLTIDPANTSPANTAITIPAKTKINSDTVKFETVREETIAAGSTTAEINIVSLAQGKNQNLPAGVALHFENPIQGVTAEVKENIVNGRGVESDNDFRERWKDSQVRLNNGLFEDLVSETVRASSGDVLYSKTYYNNKKRVDSNNVPANGYEVVVRFSSSLEEPKRAAAAAVASIIPPFVSPKASTNPYEFESRNGGRFTYYLKIASLETCNVTYNLDVDSDWSDSDTMILKRRVIQYLGGIWSPAEGDPETYDGLINFVGGKILLPRLNGLVFELFSDRKIQGLLKVNSITCVAGSKTIGGNTNKTILEIDYDKFINLNNDNITINTTVVTEASLEA